MIRRRGAGIRPADRQAAAVVGRARPHPPSDSYGGRSRPTGVSPGRLPHQRRAGARQTGPCSSRCATPWAAYLVNIRTGHIIWTLGGRHLELQARPKAGLPVAGTTSRCSPATWSRCSRPPACQLTSRTYVSASSPFARAHAEARTCTPQRRRRVTDYGVDLQIDSATTWAMSSPLPNGNVFLVGWGSDAYISEVHPLGTQIFGAILPGEDLTTGALVDSVGRPPASRPLSRPAPPSSPPDDGLTRAGTAPRRVPRGRAARRGAAPPRSRRWRAPRAPGLEDRDPAPAALFHLRGARAELPPGRGARHLQTPLPGGRGSLPRRPQGVEEMAADPCTGRAPRPPEGLERRAVAKYPVLAPVPRRIV